MATRTKLSVSFPPALAKAIRRAARRDHSGNVSAWLVEAASQALRHDESARAVAEWEAEHGRISPAERAEARRRWLE